MGKLLYAILAAFVVCPISLVIWSLGQGERPLIEVRQAPDEVHRSQDVFYIAPASWSDVNRSMRNCSRCRLGSADDATAIIWFSPGGSDAPITPKRLVIFSREPRAFHDNPWSDIRPHLALTYNLDSNVPISYMPSNFVKTVYGFPIPAQEDFDARHTAIWLSTNCMGTAWPRQQTVEWLQQYIQIDCLGGCLTNGVRLQGNGLHAAHRYKLWIGFEKSIEQEYVTEKAFNAFMGNTLLVYIGSSRISVYAPSNNSYVDALLFDSVHDLGGYLQRLASNYTLWREYFQWRAYAPPPRLADLELFSWDNDPLCRLCDCLDTERCSDRRPGEGLAPNLYNLSWSQ